MLKIKKIRPMFTALVTTMDRYENDIISDEGLIDTTRTKGSIKEYQRVISVGSLVRDIKEGDLVCINPTRFAVKRHQAGSLKDGIITDNPVTGYNFDIIDINDKHCLLLQDRDIDFIVDEYEEIPNKISKLIKPEEKKLIS